MAGFYKFLATVSRVERHVVSKTHPLYDLIDDYSFRSKNLYNYANYIIRQQFFKDGTILSEYTVSKMCKPADCYKDLMAQMSQQVIKSLSKNWKSYKEAAKDYEKSPDKYTGKPRIPGYKDKTDGRNTIFFTNQACKLKDGSIQFPKIFNQFRLKTNVSSHLQQVRIVPRADHYIIEVVYRTIAQTQKEDNGRYMSLDIGLDNFATIVNNYGSSPVIVNGKGLKSMNKFYNKGRTHYQEVAQRMNGRKSTKRLRRLSNKRNRKIDDYIHKASRYVIDLAVNYNVSVVVIGNNKDWKRECPLSKVVNQSFVGIPHQRFISMIQYKAEEKGITVILTEESYTSGTSFLDHESPSKEYYNKSRRIKRGLFKSNSGRLINSDVNGAYQIMKKVFPKTFVEGIEDMGLYPIRVAI